MSGEAAIEAAIVVGAADQNGKRLAFSHYGETVDKLNYSKTSKTTIISGKYRRFSGTSLASAVTSGLSALFLSQHPELTLEQILQRLKLFTRVGELN